MDEEKVLSEEMLDEALHEPGGLDIGVYKKHAISDIDWYRLLTSFGLAVTLAIIMEVALAGTLAVVGSESTVVILVALLAVFLAMLFVISGATASVYANAIENRRGIHKTGPLGAFNKALPVFVSSILVTLLSCVPALVPMALFGLTETGSTAIFIAAIISTALAIFLTILIALTYSMATYFIIEGMGPIQAMRQSRKTMSGHAGDYFILNLSFIGWYMVASLFASTLQGFSTMPATLIGEASAIGIIITIISMVAISIIAIVPVNIYNTMTQIEFFEDLNRQPLNDVKERSSSKLVGGIAAICIGLTVLSAATLALPFGRVPLDSKLGSFLEIDDEEEEEQKPVGTKEINEMHYDVPSDFEAFTTTDKAISYYNEHSDMVLITFTENMNLERAKSEYPDGRDITVGGYEAYTYAVGGGDTISYYTDIHTDKGLYHVRCDDQETLDKVVNSITF